MNKSISLDQNKLRTYIDQVGYKKDDILYPIDWDNFYFIDELNGFCQWAIKNSYSIGKGGHPIDDANIEYGKKLKEWNDKRIYKKLQRLS